MFVDALINTGHSPQYLQELVTMTSDVTSRSRPGVSCLLAWNSLLASLQNIRDHRAFKRNLKTELFNRVYMTTNCFVYYALLVTYGVSGALEKR